ncbi:MAG: hypothetical protein ACWA5X_12180 [bacterium]
MNKTFLFLFVVSLLASQAAFASNVSQLSTFGLNDVVHSDADDGKGDPKKPEGEEEEPDCE